MTDSPTLYISASPRQSNSNKSSSMYRIENKMKRLLRKTEKTKSSLLKESRRGSPQRYANLKSCWTDI